VNRFSARGESLAQVEGPFHLKRLSILISNVDHFQRIMQAILKFRPGLAYTLRNGLYLSLTNNSPCLSLLNSRGPSFCMPFGSNFSLLKENEPEPSSCELSDIVNEVYSELEVVGMGESDAGVTFAGGGDPLLKLDVLLDTIAEVKQRRHGIRFGVNTSGLFDASVPALLRQGGVKDVSVSLNASNPNSYSKLMNPTNGKNFQDVCSFIIASAEAGLSVTCTAVETPGTNLKEIRDLALALGSTEFKSRSFHP